MAVLYDRLLTELSLTVDSFDSMRLIRVCIIFLQCLRKSTLQRLALVYKVLQTCKSLVSGVGYTGTSVGLRNGTVHIGATNMFLYDIVLSVHKLMLEVGLPLHDNVLTFFLVLNINCMYVLGMHD